MLLFSTMTKLLDLLEAYLAWRRVPDPSGSGAATPLTYLRIDGGTALEARSVTSSMHCLLGCIPSRYPSIHSSEHLAVHVFFPPSAHEYVNSSTHPFVHISICHAFIPS